MFGPSHQTAYFSHHTDITNLLTFLKKFTHKFVFLFYLFMDFYIPVM